MYRADNHAWLFGVSDGVAFHAGPSQHMNWITTTGGVVLGCILALAAGVQLSHMYQIPRLPLYYLVGGVLLLWIVGLLAVLVPALRAACLERRPAEHR